MLKFLNEFLMEVLEFFQCSEEIFFAISTEISSDACPRNLEIPSVNTQRLQHAFLQELYEVFPHKFLQEMLK